MSRQVASKLEIETPADFLRLVQPIVQDVLKPTSFSLNDRKTRVSDLRGGHTVTGLSVGKSQVNLPRETRRRLRGLLHRIERDGVVSVAEERIGAERFAELCSWTSAILGDSNPGRKTSRSEASIAGFIRSICPKLVTEIPEQTFAVGTKRVIRDYQLHEGQSAVRDCLYLLPYVWRGEVSARIEGGHLEIRRIGDGHHMASLRAERNIEVLALSSRQFHATLNPWLHLRGWAAGLHTPAGDSCFSEVSHFRETIQRCVDKFQIQLPTSVESESDDANFELGRKVSGFSLQPNVTGLSEAAHRVYLLIEETEFHACKPQLRVNLK